MAESTFGPDWGESQKPKTSDPYEDTEAISSRIDRLLATDRWQRSLFEREWARNLYFAAGQQSIIFENGRWRPRRLPAWYPRAQTNKFLEKANDIVTTLLQTDPTIRYIPASDDPEDEATADVGEQLREVLYEEAKIDDKRAELAMWIALTGNGFLIPYYDLGEQFGSRSEPAQQCLTCQNTSMPSEIADQGGFCPVCAEQGITSNSFMPDPDGRVEQFPIGAIQTEVVSPFEIRIDHRVRTMAEQRRFIRQKRYDVDFAKEVWKDHADQIVPDSGNDLSQYYLDILAHITSSFAASSGIVGGGPSSSKNPKVTIYKFYEKPSEDFPEGLEAIRAGMGTSTSVLEAGPLDTEYGAGVLNGTKFLPLIHIGFDTLPGRFWKRTRMDDLVPLQLFRNTVEANLRITAQRMGNPKWLNPKGSGVSIFHGESGQVIDYNPVSVGSGQPIKPEPIEASLGNVQPMIILMNKIDDSMERVAGTFFLQGGETPPGVTAASALAYLGEKAEKTMSPIVREWARGFKEWEQMALEIARAKWDDARLRVVAGKNRKWDVQKFRKADIQGAVNLKIDYQSIYPKSVATERATIQLLVEGGVLNPQDPETNWRLLEAFGETKLKGSIDLDVREAVHEADHFLNGGAPMLIPLVQNSTVHRMQHTDFAKTDEFKELPDERKQVWYAHIAAHVADEIRRMQLFSMANLNPDDPKWQEFSEGEAEVAAQTAQGMQQPQQPESPMPMQAGPSNDRNVGAADMRTPDIAGGGQGKVDQGGIQMPPGVRPIQAPRAIGQ